MIKASELRIGNWVYGFKTTWSIEASDFRRVDYDNNEVPYNPIPIAEEWLLKMGFVADKYNGSQGNTSSYMKKTHDFIGCYKHINLIGEDGLFYFQCNTKGVYTSGVKIKYIHQLQNLYFALTGEELEIK